MPESVQIDLAGVPLRLTADPAVVSDDGSTAFVADVHLGKAASFRRGGVPVPESTTARDLDRLTALVERWGVRRLVVLGDLAHARAWLNEATQALVGAWRARHAGLELVCVRGNHDRRAGPTPASLRIGEVDEPHEMSGLWLKHDPGVPSASPSLSGHLHPVLRVAPPGGGRGVRARCFWERGGALVLPAFGSFTGGVAVDARAPDRAWLTAEGAVVAAPLGAVSGGPRARRASRV